MCNNKVKETIILDPNSEYQKLAEILGYKLISEEPDGVTRYINPFEIDTYNIMRKIELPEECGKLILSIFKKYKAEEPLTSSTEDSIETVTRWIKLAMSKED